MWKVHVRSLWKGQREGTGYFHRPGLEVVHIELYMAFAHIPLATTQSRRPKLIVREAQEHSLPKYPQRENDVESTSPHCCVALTRANSVQSPEESCSLH